MRYAPGHRERTREKILNRAARLFRKHGYRGVSIERIMSAAGLTRGGFYAHFASKEALFASVIERETDFVQRLRDARESTPPSSAEGACEVVRGYLDPANREKVARGCNLATLTSDLPRAGGSARRAYARQVERLVGELEAHLPRELSDGRARALTAAALCVGGIGLARGVGDEALASEVLEVCSERACEALRGD
jgi:AcrR family transcriptional regulator